MTVTMDDERLVRSAHWLAEGKVEWWKNSRTF